MLQSRYFNIANMSFNVVCENKFLVICFNYSIGSELTYQLLCSLFRPFLDDKKLSYILIDSCVSVKYAP